MKQHMSKIHEEKKYGLNVNVVIKNSPLDVPLSGSSWRNEIWFKCEYYDKKSATRCTMDVPISMKSWRKEEWFECE